VTSEEGFLWVLPTILTVAIGFQLRAGRVPLYWTPRGWRVVEKSRDEGRFWLFILAEVAATIILIGQALSA
jgi:hypothetical protein